MEVQTSLSNNSKHNTSSSVKIPKLFISKFARTPQNWVKFWGQYKAQIHISAVYDVTTFSYLKELVDIGGRKLIVDLPFTSEEG